MTPTTHPTTKQWLSLHDQVERTLSNLDMVRRMNMHWPLYIKKAEILRELLTFTEAHGPEAGLTSMKERLEHLEATHREAYEVHKEDYDLASLKLRGTYEGAQVGLLYLSYLEASPTP